MMRLLFLLSLSLAGWVCRLGITDDTPGFGPRSIHGDETRYTVVQDNISEILLKTYDTKTRKELFSSDLETLTKGKPVFHVVLSGNGERVFAETETDIEVFELVGDKWKSLTSLPGPITRNRFAVSTDGTIAWVGKKKCIEQYSVGAKSERISSIGYHNEHYQLSASNDGNTAIVQAPLLSRFGTQRFTSKEGEITEDPLGSFHVRGTIEISDDGKRIAFLTTLNEVDFQIVVMNTDTRRVKYFPIDETFGSMEFSRGFALSRDGTRVAVASKSNVGVIRVATGKMTLVKAPERKNLMMSFSREGSMLLGADFVIPLEK